MTNTVPDFGSETVADQNYTVGTSIGTVMLPPATGGNGASAYTLAPALPSGLTFTAADRTLTGTPAAGTARAATTYTYTASDSDTNTAPTDAGVLMFTIQIVDPPASPVMVTLNAGIAGNDIVNIAEQVAGFDITGTVDTGATVSVTIDSGNARPATVTDTTWTVTIPADDNEIAGTSVTVTATATVGSTTGEATRVLTVDLTPPTATYAAPATLTVGTPITAITPGTPSADISAYAVQSGTLPPGLRLDGTGGGISGTPTMANANPAPVTIGLTDTNDNPADVLLTFPAVTIGSQTLAGFAYSAATATVGQSAPMVLAPTGAVAGSILRYASGDTNICTVNAATGALTPVAAGNCVITVTAPATANYQAATATFTITVSEAPVAPTVSDVAFTSTGPYALGEAIEVTVTFSENVTVTDIPEIELNINGNLRAATYTSGSNSANLVFIYTVSRRGDRWGRRGH